MGPSTRLSCLLGRIAVGAAPTAAALVLAGCAATTSTAATTGTKTGPGVASTADTVGSTATGPTSTGWAPTTGAATASAPGTAPVALRVGTRGAAVCTVPAAARLADRAVLTASDPAALVELDLDPTAATLVWLPGLDATACTAQLTVADATAARRLAADVDASPAAPPGPASCPADDGAAVLVFLRHPGRDRAEVIVIALTGCQRVYAPGHGVREQSAPLRADLQAAAPAAWSGYLARG